MQYPTSSICIAKVLAGCLFVGIVGLLAALLMCSHAGPPALSAQFLRYSIADGEVTPTAVLRITNSTGCTWLLPLASDPASADHDDVWSVECMFSDKTATGWTNGYYRPIHQSGGTSSVNLAPYSSLDVTVPLAETRMPRKVGFICIQDYQGSTRRLDKMRRWMEIHLSARYTRLTIESVWCERELNWPSDAKPTTRPMP
jgi:hypothetical protein